MSVRLRFALLAFALFAADLRAPAQNPATTVTVDAGANRHAINPNVYGVAFGDGTTLPDLNAPLNRYGGNNTSRYNWQINGDNRGQDWYFESIGDTSSTAGERGDTFFSTSKGAGAQALITVPMVGWVAKLGSGRNKLASFSIGKYGAQTGNDWQWFPDAGNGVLSSTGQNVTGNDPNDADVPADSTFQQAWIQHLVSTWGKAVNGGVGYYLLDNESSIWFSTHRDVHPIGPTMDEIEGKMVDYSGKIKAVDPTALVVGPEEWGWSGYFYSGYDQQWGSQHGWSNLPDRANHGGQDYLPWLLSQLKASAIGTGQRPIDIFSVHYYPQSGEFGDDVSSAMQLLRNKSTRSLWDPNYVDQSWINDKVQLIPRLKNWVSTFYFAGTPVALTEYNWGAESNINGATTQADIFGIFGREGLDLATRWTTPDPSTPTYKAMKMYRNYDGNKSTFGDTSVSTAVANPDNLSAFGAVRTSDGALTVMVINKVSGSTPVTVALNNFSGNGAAQVYQLTAANAIQHLSNISYSGTSLGVTVPAQSITLLILPKSSVAIPATPVLVAPSSATAGVAMMPSLSWNAATGATSYDVYFGTSSTPPLVTNVTGTSYSPGTLSVGTTYYWQIVAKNTGGSASSAIWSFTVGSAATTVSVSPGSGSGLSQALTFTFADVNGWQSFQVIDILINGALDGRQACYVAFVPGATGTGTALLVDNAGDAGGPYSSLPLPGTGTAQNSQCTIHGTGSSVVMSGHTLTLTLSYTFNSSFAGDKIIYTAASDSVGNNSGWQMLGTWAVPGSAPTGPSVTSVSPARSTTMSQAYTFTFADTAGGQDIQVIDVLINGALDGRHACYIAFAPTGAGSGTVMLVDDAGDAGGPFATLSLPGTGTAQNSQCSIAGTGSSVTGSGNNLTLTLNLTFNAGFAGNRLFYVAVRGSTANSGWQTAGSVTVP